MISCFVLDTLHLYPKQEPSSKSMWCKKITSIWNWFLFIKLAIIIYIYSHQSGGLFGKNVIKVLNWMRVSWLVNTALYICLVTQSPLAIIMSLMIECSPLAWFTSYEWNWKQWFSISAPFDYKKKSAVNFVNFMNIFRVLFWIMNHNTLFT